MKVCVQGLWHLGSVTAACLASYGIDTVGLDPSAQTIANLDSGIPPLFEPGLAELVAKGRASQHLAFTTDPATALAGADIVWVAFDTPVDEEDKADVGYVQGQVESLFPYLQSGTVVLISSQMPVGSIAALERKFSAVADGRSVSFACSPENLRLGKAIDVFTNPGRIVIGVRDDLARAKLEPLLSKICETLIWMRVESAEMTKHALNSFLAMCVSYANEIATLCEDVGADAGEVERGIRSDPRVGRHSYVKAGAAFGGGTLARDVRFLEGLAAERGLPLAMLGNVVASNNAHRRWALRALKARVGDLRGRRVAMLGLSYKPGTDAIRRSVAIELCELLLKAGATVHAFDPQVRSLPAGLANVIIAASPYDATAQADALIVATEWPEFRELDIARLTSGMIRPLVLDQSRFMEAVVRVEPSVSYVTVGEPA